MKQFTFNDILIEPAYSDTEREDVSIETTFGAYSLDVPVLASPMDSVTNFEVVQKMREYGGLGIHHRYCDHYELLRSARQEGGIAVSPSMPNVLLKQALEINPNQVAVIDVAHGYTVRNLDFAKRLLDMGYKYVVSGNIATPDAGLEYIKTGVKYLRVGIGAGHACITRTEMGVGVPQAYAVYSMYKYLSEIGHEFHIISDGGHRNTGDIVKSLALGADYVMLGSMLAGVNESPMGNVYRGMASEDAQLARGKEGAVIEGVTKKVTSKGSLKSVMNRIKDNLEQACYYTGSRNLEEMKEAKWNLITNNAYMEGLA